MVSRRRFGDFYIDKNIELGGVSMSDNWVVQNLDNALNTWNEN